MKPPTRQVKIKIDTHFMSEEDLNDLLRWEDEGGLPGTLSGLLSSKALPVHKEEIFEVIDSDIITEKGQLYILAEINLLSHH